MEQEMPVVDMRDPILAASQIRQLMLDRAELIAALEAIASHFSKYVTGVAMPEHPTNWEIFEQTRAAIEKAKS